MTQNELEACIYNFGKEIYSFCIHLAGDVQEAEDLYQDTFLKVMELGPKIDFSYNPKSYILSVALRLWKNRKRKYAWRKRIAGEAVIPQEIQEDGEASVEDELLLKEERHLVQNAVAQLPERLKIPVLLFYMEELSVAQISAVMKIPQGTVKSRLYQARKLLEKELEVVLNEKNG